MSYGTPRIINGLKAGADLSDAANNGLAVKISADHTVVKAALATNIMVGILHKGNVSGKVVEVAGNGAGCFGRSGAAFAAGLELTCNAAGKLIAATVTGSIVIAISKEAATAADQLVDIEVVNRLKA